MTWDLARIVVRLVAQLVARVMTCDMAWILARIVTGLLARILTRIMAQIVARNITGIMTGGIGPPSPLARSSHLFCKKTGVHGR